MHSFCKYLRGAAASQRTKSVSIPCPPFVAGRRAMSLLPPAPAAAHVHAGAHSAAKHQIPSSGLPSAPWGFLPDPFREVAVDALKTFWSRLEQRHVHEGADQGARLEHFTGGSTSEFQRGAILAYRRMAEEFNRAVRLDMSQPGAGAFDSRFDEQAQQARQEKQEKQEEETDGERMCSDGVRRLFCSSIGQWRQHSTKFPQLHVHFVQADVISVQCVADMSRLGASRPLMRFVDYLLPKPRSGVMVQVLFKVRETFSLHARSSSSSSSSSSSPSSAEEVSISSRDRTHLWSFGAEVSLPKLLSEVWLDSSCAVRDGLTWRVVDVNGLVVTNGFASLPEYLSSRS